MIKKITLLKTYKDKFPLPVDLFKIEPPMIIEDNSNEVNYLLGGFYKTDGYSMYAFYLSDKDGEILNDEPVIMNEGLNTYVDIFKSLGYTYI